jgi:outer membrane lipoprotein SlyB
MSAPFIVPFNFQPVSVSVKTGSYTIPSGKYARVYVECENGGTFTINGNTAMDTDALLSATTHQTNSGIAVTYTTPANYRAEVIYLDSGTINGFVGGNSGGVLKNNYFSIGPGQTVSTSNIGTFGSIIGSAIPGNATNRNADFWLPTGTVINGTGIWRAVVMEYNEIT